LYLDGILIQRELHNPRKNNIVQIELDHLSLETHYLSIDVVDSEGKYLQKAIESHVFHVVDDSTSCDESGSTATELYMSQIEPFEEYDPYLTDEERRNAQLKDGWLVIHQHIEFMRIESDDLCENVGWKTRQHPRRIFDAFQFFNELDILEIRLQELKHVVHKFILVEATKTHSNQPKPLHYELNKQRFAEFHNKIIHVVVQDLPNSTDPWVLENFQRNAMMRGLKKAHPNDLVVIADVDEIPASYILDAVRSCDGPTSPTWLYSRFFNLKFEWEFQGQWKHPQIVRYANLLGSHGKAVTPQQVRMGAMKENHTKIESAGWHCSFFSDVDGVIQKVKAFTHQELNRQVSEEGACKIWT
jgi:beta-1,4-mannosyl-glycoprotein beta-1,4-N-acetylglucosaminyltransferase